MISGIDSKNINVKNKFENTLKHFERKTKKFDLEFDKRISEKPHKKPVDKKLMNACFDMESIFVSKMLKEMRKTIHETGWINGGHAEKIFKDMLYDEYSSAISKNANLGLAKQIYRELSNK